MTAWVQRRSFQGRLTATIALAVGIAIALVAVVSYFAVSRQLNDQVNARLVGTYAQLGSGQGFRPNIALVAAEQQGNIVEAVERAGNPLPPSGFLGGDSPTDNESSTILTPTAAQRAAATGPSDYHTITRETQGGVDYRVLTMRIDVTNQATGITTPAALLVATNLTPTLHTLARLRLALYILLLAGIAVALMLGLGVSRLTLRPVKRLTAAAEHVAATQELDATIEVDSADELGRLAYSFNEMLAALAASRRQQAQLVSDAGHELRTPLTSLRTNVELLMRAKQLPEADQRELYGDIDAQVEELTTLIGDLVELARQDEQQPDPVEVRLDSIVEHGIQRAQRRAPSVTFDVDLTAGSVRAHPPLLERAVLNVFDNAAKWSPPGGTVWVRLRRGDVWVLEVRDQGPGIAAEDLPHIFDRFYRADTARSMPGSGLGLAIVHQVIATHGGEVSIVSPPDGGTIVRIELPTVIEQEPGARPETGLDEAPEPPGMPPRPPKPAPPGLPPSTPPATGDGAGPLAPAGLSGPGSGPATP